MYLLRSRDLNSTRRGFLKKAVYVAPAVITMTALPAIAGNGSEPDFKPYEADAAPVRWQSKAMRRKRARQRRKRLERQNSNI